MSIQWYWGSTQMAFKIRRGPVSVFPVLPLIMKPLITVFIVFNNKYVIGKILEVEKCP